MRRAEPQSEAWKKMVLRSMAAPAWLAIDAPDGDVVISSRVRYARNLRGYAFPHHAEPEEIRAVHRAVKAAAEQPSLALRAQRRLSEAERDFLLGCRLISPEFRHREPGRALFLDEGRMVSLMVNEEDHLRLQALTAGWSLGTAHRAADAVLDRLSARLEFMHDPRWGYLTGSPTNCGDARRRSALFHLIGLAQSKRLLAVLKALGEWGLTARGLFGESSRAIGWFFQVSAVRASLPEFRGACEYLVSEERLARRGIPMEELTGRYEQARTAAIAAGSLSLADALRVLAWVRWAATVGLAGAPGSHRQVDHWISTMEVHGTQDKATAARHRAEFLRVRLEGR